MEIYLTEINKKRIEAEIAELEKEINEKSLEFTDNKYTCGHLSGQCRILKEILSSAIILPVEESWDNVDFIHDYSQPQLNDFYPNGVIIQPK